MKWLEWKDMTINEIESSRIKAYTYLDDFNPEDTEMKYLYTNKLGRELKCYIIKYDNLGGGFVVRNENGVNAFIKTGNLKQIK